MKSHISQLKMLRQVSDIVGEINNRLCNISKLSDKETLKLSEFLKEFCVGLEFKIIEFDLSGFTENEINKITELKKKSIANQNFEHAATLRNTERLYLQAAEVLKELEGRNTPVFRTENNNRLVFYHFGKLGLEKQIKEIIQKMN